MFDFLSDCKNSNNIVSGTDLPKIDVLDKFIPEELFLKIQKECLSSPLNYGWKAHCKNDPHGHWNRNFVETDRENLADVSDRMSELQKELWNYLSDNIDRLKNKAVIRCYMNGHTYGTDGYFHTDSDRDNEISAVLYLNDTWKLDWSGELVIADKNEELIKAIIPKRNRLVVFPSNILHCARGVSRVCNGLRMSFILKVRSIRSLEFERLSSFLYKNGASTMKHKKGSLHDHLVRTYQLLEDKKQPSTVCLAGGLHSVFGTNIFKNCLFSHENRAIIVDTFGNDVYQLVHLFGSINRPDTLECPLDYLEDGKIIVVESREKIPIQISRDQYFFLCWIECANLIDQSFLENGKYTKLSSIWNGSFY